MTLIKTKIEGLFILEPRVFKDGRGWFFEPYNQETFAGLGINVDFVQDNHSYSSQKGVLRGIHLQLGPKSQSKLVRCTRGAVLDVAVDLRKGSATYKKWVSIELSAENRRMFFIPKGFGHGFLTLTDDCEFQYKVDNLYAKEHERAVKYNDPELNIDWGGIEPILSEKDQNAPFLREIEHEL